jgi:voltage-gated potassium channel
MSSLPSDPPRTGPAWSRRIGSKLHELYHGETPKALRFQLIWLIFDAALIVFFMLSPFLKHGMTFLIVDYAIALILFLDLAARAWGYGHFGRWLSRPIVWADIAVLLSLVVPVYAANLGFLRIVRAYSLVNGRSFWRVFGRPFAKWEEQIKAACNLAVFIFMMTALVHTLFAGRVPHLGSYADSLYFTVTSLTTTGYGDIVLPGVLGRLLSIFIMIGGVSLFFRLIQVVMRPVKVKHRCKTCGLLRHEPDAVHCKACGELIDIPDDND